MQLDSFWDDVEKKKALFTEDLLCLKVRQIYSAAFIVANRAALVCCCFFILFLNTKLDKFFEH